MTSCKDNTRIIFKYATSHEAGKEKLLHMALVCMAGRWDDKVALDSADASHRMSKLSSGEQVRPPPISALLFPLPPGD